MTPARPVCVAPARPVWRRRGLAVAAEALDRGPDRVFAGAVGVSRPGGGAQCAQAVDALALSGEFQAVPVPARRPAAATVAAGLFRCGFLRARVRLEQPGQVLGQVSGTL